jgi:hypothetical protein
MPISIEEIRQSMLDKLKNDPSINIRDGAIWINHFDDSIWISPQKASIRSNDRLLFTRAEIDDNLYQSQLISRVKEILS